jgi:hypothetical protein
MPLCQPKSVANNKGDLLMPKAVLKNGIIYPLEPLPPEWPEGQQLRVEASFDEEDEDLDTWYRELQALVAQNDPNDWASVEQAIKTANEQAKALVRKQMGLP